MKFKPVSYRQNSKGRVFKISITSLLAVAAVVFLFQTFTSRADRTEVELEKTLTHLDTLENQIKLEEKRIAELRRLKYHRHGEIGPGQGMFQVLHEMGISHGMRLELVNTLSDSVELLNLSVGEKVSIELDPEDSTNVLSFSYSPNPAVVHKLIKGDTAFVYKRVNRPTTIRHRLIEGDLKQGSSLDQTLRELGIPSFMVGVVNGVLLCKIPFRTHARAGDQFRILLEERFYQDSIFIEGKVLYTCYEGMKAGFYEAFRYDDGDPKSSYTAHYTEDGEALIHSGLRYPLNRLHISSPYGMRFHPVFGTRKMHWGVDYRAPTGTPVYAVAPGKVVKSGYTKANGHYIAIRHPDNYTSYYLHLHRRLVGRGQSVNARQIIGKVGSTGISTGPHLHFGFKRPNGRWMDPLRKRMIATPKLKGERLARLKAQTNEIKVLVDSLGTGSSKRRMVALKSDEDKISSN
ncbi:MAG: M23 family metallopeptidase [Chitinispirillaceae bacterium]